MKNLKRILEIVAYQRDEEGDFKLIFRQPNGYYNVIEGQNGYGMSVMLEGVLKLEHWVDVRTWMRMKDNLIEEEKKNDKPILGDLNALTELKEKMTQDTLPDVCPECGQKLRHKMSGRICDNYPCNYYESL